MIADGPDAVLDRAVAAGATVVWLVGDQCGLRVGRVVDPVGHHWEIGNLCRYRDCSGLPNPVPVNLRAN